MHARRWILGWVVLLTVLVALGFFCHPAHAEARIFGFYGGVNGYWPLATGAAFHSDVELGLNAKASLSPHLSVVGALYRGFDHSYWRYTAGGRVTVSDVENPNFSIGLGIQRHGGSEALLGVSEWATDATVGIKPWPEVPGAKESFINKIILIGQGAYGMTTKNATAIAGLRYELPY